MARQYEHRTRGDVITVPKELEKKYDEHPDWKRHTAASTSSSSSRPVRKRAAKKATAKKAAAPNPASTSSS